MDMPYEILERIWLHLCQVDAKSFWRSSQVNHSFLKLTRELLTSDKHGEFVAKKLVHFALPILAYFYFLSKCMRKYDITRFDYQKFMTHSLQWDVIKTPYLGKLKQKPDRVGNLKEVLGCKNAFIRCIHRYDHYFIIHELYSHLVIQTTLDFQKVAEKRVMMNFTSIINAPSLPFYFKEKEGHKNCELPSSDTINSFAVMKSDMHYCSFSHIGEHWYEGREELEKSRTETYKMAVGKTSNVMHYPFLVEEKKDSYYIYDYLGLVKFRLCPNDLFKIDITDRVTRKVRSVKIDTWRQIQIVVTSVFMTWNSLFLGTADGDVYAYHLNNPMDLLKFNWKSYFWIGQGPTRKAITNINFEFSQSISKNPDFIVMAANRWEVMWWRIKPSETQEK